MADEPTDNKARIQYEAGVDEASFKNAEKRAVDSVNRVSEANKQSTRDAEREARNQRRTFETNQQEETAHLRAQQRERDRVQREATSFAKTMHADEGRAYAEQLKRETAQLREAAAIRKAMHQDELKQTERQRTAEAAYWADRRRHEREARERQLYSPGQMGSFRRESTTFLDMLGGGAGGGPGGPGGGGRRGGRGWGGGQGIDPFLTSLGFGLGATGAPGARLAGTVALGQGFGGREGLYGGLLGGAVAVAAVAAIKTIKDALADTASENKFAASLLQIGANFNTGRVAAESFGAALAVNRIEARSIAAAFAAASTKVETKPGDITGISARATATGQNAEDLAKTLQSIAQGNREAFEEQTGLKATIVINEYARAIGKVPAQLTKVQEAQALYNKFVLQGANYQELATVRMASAEGRWERFKAGLADFSADYGRALLTTYGSGLYRTKDLQRETDAAFLAQDKPIIRGQLDEQKRQRELDLRYESVAKEGEFGLKIRQREKPGETAAERLKVLIRFREEFDSLTAGLDIADSRIKAVSESVEQQFSQAVGRAYNEVEQLRKSTRSMTGELAALQLPGQSNPYVKLYSDAAEAADKAYDRFRVLGDKAVDQYARMQRAAIDAQIFQVQVQTTMKATSLEFEAAHLSKPFIELTGEMKRSLSILQTEVTAATSVPKMLAQATAIDLYARFQRPRANERAFGLFGVSETSDTFVAQQQFDKILKLRRQYAGEGFGGREAQHVLDIELIKLFSSLPPGLQARALRAPGARGPGGFANVFQGAFRGEAGYANEQVDLAVQRAIIGRQAAAEAQAKLKELQRLGGDPRAQRGALRAEILAITGALPREELTPDLLKGRIDALREEAVFQRQSQEAAVKAVQEAQALKAMLDQRLQDIQDSIKRREDSVLLRVLDDSGRTRINTLGPAMSNSGQAGTGAAAF